MSRKLTATQLLREVQSMKKQAADIEVGGLEIVIKSFESRINKEAKEEGLSPFKVSATIHPSKIPTLVIDIRYMAGLSNRPEEDDYIQDEYYDRYDIVKEAFENEFGQNPEFGVFKADIGWFEIELKLLAKK